LVEKSNENSVEKSNENSVEKSKEKPFIRSNAIESLELLSNFSLIDEAFELIAKNNAIETIISLLSFEISQEDQVLLEKGELSNNERLITASLKFLNFSLLKHRISNINCEKIEKNLILVINSGKFSAIQIYEAIKALRNMLKYEENENFLLKSCLKEGLLDVLIEKLEKYRENTDISQEINGFFLEMTRISQEIAEFLSEKDFLRILLKETRGVFREFLNEESAEKLLKLKENLNFLMIFSMLGEKPAKKLFEGGCEDLCLNIILKKSKENVMNFEEISQNEDFFTNLSVIFPETLRILLNLAEFNDILDKKLKEFVVLLQIISNFFQKREICVLSVELFLKIMTKELKVELQSIFFANFSKICSFFPLDEKLDSLLCGLFYQINPLIYHENLKNFDENSLEISLFPLANSLLIYKDPKHQVFLTEFEVSRSNEVLLFFTDKLPKNVDNLIASLIFFSRLCCFSSIKSQILKSAIPKLIFLMISSHFSSRISPNSSQNSSGISLKLLEISLSTLIEILNFPFKNTEKIDNLTFEYREIQTSFTITEALCDLFLSNSGKFIKEILFFAENSDESSSKISQKSLELLFVIAYLHPAIAVFLSENCGLSKLQSLYEDICKRSRFSEEKSLVLKLCKLISAMARIQSCFLEIMHKTDFLEILLEKIKSFQVNLKENSNVNSNENSNVNSNENSNENSIENTKENSNTKELEEYLWCLGTFSNNFFDKMQLLEKKTIEILLEKFGDLQRNLLENWPSMVQLLKTSKILLKDPAIARFICAKNANFELFEDFLKKLHKENSKVLPFNENMEFKPEEIESSSDFKEKTIENLFDVFIEMTRNPMIIESSEFFTGGFIEEVMGIVKENQSNFIIIVRGLKIIENSMKAVFEKTKNTKKIEIEGLLEFISKIQKKIENIEEFLGFFQ